VQKILPPLGFDPWAIQPEVTIPTELSQPTRYTWYNNKIELFKARKAETGLRWLRIEASGSPV